MHIEAGIPDGHGREERRSTGDVARSTAGLRRSRALLALLLFGLAPLAPRPARALTINLNMGADLAANAAASAAFERAAQTWQSVFSDPVTVNIDANLTPLADPNVIGATSPVFLHTDYNSARSALIADAGANEGILNFLPTAAQFNALIPAGPVTIGFNGLIASTKADFKALGYTGLDAQFGATDATIDFNSNFAFDYDPSNGIDANKQDFTATAIHEIGHALGFVSGVDAVDNALLNNTNANVSIFPLDLFRFPADALPTTTAEFTTFARDFFPPDAADFSDLANVWGLSTGVNFGDGNQASHWKDDNSDPSRFIGVMDPTSGFGEGYDHITYADERALGLIGWDLVQTPEPGSLGLLALGLGFVGLGMPRRRRAG